MILCSVLLSLLFSQEKIDLFIADVLSGKKDSANYYLSFFEENFPNNPKMLFMKGLLDTDGEKAMQIFVKLYNNFPTNEYADDSVMKVSEYYYTSGLYIKSAEWLKKMPLFFSRSEHIERALKLFMNSLIVSGNKDTAIFYSKVFKRQFPRIDIDTKISSLLHSYDNNTLYEKNKDRELINNQKLKKNVYDKKNINKKLTEFSLQSGAFGLRDNAIKQKAIFDGSGFDARVVDLNRKEKKLYVVRIGFYETREKAEKEGRKIKNKLDLSTIVVKNK